MKPTGAEGSHALPALRVFHLDDNIFELERIEKALDATNVAKFSVESFSDASSFVDRVKRAPFPQIILLDIKIGRSGESGLSLAEKSRALVPEAVILMRSSISHLEVITEALAKGADDYLFKESDDAELAHRLWKSFEVCRIQSTEAPVADRDLHIRRARPNVIGAKMKRIGDRVPRIAKSAVSAVHVRGESGVGKEVVAALFEAHLPRTMPFQKINCGAIAPNLLESELFGHKKGAFTDAKADKKGLIEAAAGGWIFLDEVADLTLSAQAALLRVLENKEFIPVGANTPKYIDVRVISATNKSIPALVESGAFRLDLWQRLCEIEIDIPPLRERQDEIPDLVRHFCKTMAGGPYRVTAAAMQMLVSAPWAAGNVRELRNCLRAMTEKHLDGVLSPFSIPERIKSRPISAPRQLESVGESVQRAGKNEIVISWDDGQEITFDQLTDKLLVELARRETIAQGGSLSVRRFARLLKIPRAHLATRLRRLVGTKQSNTDQLNSRIGTS